MVLPPLYHELSLFSFKNKDLQIFLNDSAHNNYRKLIEKQTNKQTKKEQEYKMIPEKIL